MKRILIGLALGILLAAQVGGAFTPAPVAGMTGSGTAENPYMIYDVDDLQAMNDLMAPHYYRPWDDGCDYCEQSGTWTTYPIEGYTPELFWNKVDEETSDDDTTYIQAESNDAYALMQFLDPDPPIPIDATNIEVRIYARVRNTSSGTSAIQGMLRDLVGVEPYTDYLIGSDTSISSQSYALKYWTMSNPPWSPEREWTAADVVGLDQCGIGVKVSDASPNVRITQLYLRVTWDRYFELANDIDASATATWNPTTDRGAWATYTTYYVNDYVLYDGKYWLCWEDHTSGSSFPSYPDPVPWIDYDVEEPPQYLGFLPIGLYIRDAFEFAGSLDGQEYTIDNLHIYRPVWYASLIYMLDYGAVIENVNLTNVNFTGEDAAGISNFIGDGGGTVRNCHVTGTITAIDSHSLAAGLVGWIESGTVADCTVDVTINAADDAAGMVGWIEAGSIANSHSQGTVDVPNGWAGGLVGYASSGEVTISDSSSSCNITGLSGGGVAYGIGSSTTVRRCWASGNVTVTSTAAGFINDICAGLVEDCYALGNVSGSGYAAGFVEYIWHEAAVIRNCYARGEVTGEEGDWIGGFIGVAWGGTISNSYSTGLVAGGGSTIGGFCGENDGGTITDCFWDTETSGQATSDSGTGKTTTEMKSITPFFTAGWDIGYTGLGYYNDGYPLLSWQVGNSPTWVISSVPESFTQVLLFQPNAIIVPINDTTATLPDRMNNQDGIIYWGGNPDGITITHSGLGLDDSFYDYQFATLGPQGPDIIRPEPAPLTSDVDLARLESSPLYPMVMVMAEGLNIPARLVWLGGAIFILIALMVFIALRTEHLVFTALIGLGCAATFYFMGIFAMWVVILLVFGLIASIVYERMPVL